MTCPKLDIGTICNDVSDRAAVYGLLICVNRYMQSWEEFATRVLGNTEHTHGLINKAGQEVQNGAAIAFPKFIWIAKAV